MAKTLFQLTEGNAPLLTDYALTGEDPAGIHVLRRTTWQTIKNLFMSGVTTQNDNAWIAVTDTWTYASATTITVPTGAASKYGVGDKFMLTANSVVLQGYIVAVADTLLTVRGDALTNHTFSAKYFSHGSNPLGFTHWFNYTPTGISASNVTLTGRFCIVGRTCKVQFKAEFTGAITFTTMPTLPIPAASTLLDTYGQENVMGTAGYIDNGVGHYPSALVPTVRASATVCEIFKAVNPGDAISATVPITWANGDVIRAQFEYEI